MSMEGLNCSRSGDGPGPADEWPGDHDPALSPEGNAGDTDPDALGPAERHLRRLLSTRLGLDDEEESEPEGADGDAGFASSLGREKSSSDDTLVGAESGPPFSVPKGRFFHVTY